MKTDPDFNVLMGLIDARATAYAKQMPTTPELHASSKRIVERGRDELARQRREERARRPSNVVNGAIRAAIRAMSPSHVFAELTEMVRVHPDLHCAHRDLTHLSESDLRSALEDAMSLVERKESKD